MFKLRNSSRTGFTLLELIIAMVIMVVLSLGIATIHISGQRRFLMTGRKIRLLNQANYVMDHIAKNVREHSWILVAEDNLARLRNLDYEVIVYERFGDNRVTFTDTRGVSERLAEHITRLNFSGAGTRILKIYITAEDQRKSISLEQSITLRGPR